MKEMWLARDKDNSLFLYIGVKPIKFTSCWLGLGKAYASVMLDKKEHPEVQWSDEEPTKVKLVIDN